MSGDVQPRKRKDKKRKKDDILDQSQTSYSSSSEEVTIHVHKEDGTGGGICAKVVFFILFSILALLIGLILTEHRGLTDLETVDTESRFSQLFEGWIDSKPNEEHDDTLESTEDHLDEETEEPPDDEDQELSQEESEEADEEPEQEEEEPLESEEQEDNNEQSEENEPREEEEEEADEEQDEESQEPNVSPDQEDDDNNNGAEADQDDEDSARDNFEVEPENDDNEDEKTGDTLPNNNNYRMIVKIGVGVALLVVAHVVLVKKWKSVPVVIPEPKRESGEPLPDLSRRNTIVVPPTLQEVEQDIEEDDEEYSSDEDGEVESDEERLARSAKHKYQELRSTYTRSLTPESEPDPDGKDDYAIDDEQSDEVDEDIEDLEEEEEEDDEEAEEEEDDGELMKRLEAKYGKIPSAKRIGNPVNEGADSDSDKQSDLDVEAYEYESITNQEDWKIKEKLDEAQNLINDSAASAIKLFDMLLKHYPKSPRSVYGKAQSFDLMAEQKRSNQMVQQAIEAYLKVLELEKVPDELYRRAALRCIDRMKFIGSYSRAVPVHRQLLARFPKESKYKNQLAVTFLTMNDVERARSVLLETLSQHPNDGFALVHYGFILKTSDNKLNESIMYLQRGIQTRHDGVIDGRFYFHLGDALARLGRTKEALDVYEDGVKNGLFFSKYQRSLYNVDRLTGKPWWRKEDTPYGKLYKALEQNWEKIRNEGLSALSKEGLFQGESENLKDTGDWKQLELLARGRKNERNCAKCPFTCQLIESFPEARHCKRGQTKFSVMHPGTHVWPHCGPTNCRLRVHLGLNVPPGTFIRVADQLRSWENGKVFIFDDSYEHEVWHNGSTFRLVLIVDVWHPELTQKEINTLSPI